MRLGILDTLGLAATLVFAIPIAGFGVKLLLAEQYALAGFMLGTAGLMIYLQRVATTPEDVPIKILQKLTGGLVKAPDDDGSDDEESTETGG